MKENSALAFVLFICTLFAVQQLVMAYLSGRRVKKYAELANIAITQREFGEARHKLFLLLDSGDLADTSITFLFFYMMNTTVMRNPDKYKKIADLMRDNLVRNDNQSSLVGRELKLESEQWSSDVREMVLQNVDAIDNLMITHSVTWRMLVAIVRGLFRLARNKITPRFGTLDFIKKILAKTDQTFNTFVEAEDELRGMAHCV